MYGMEINHLANLLKDCDPTRNDSDSDEDEKTTKNTTAHLTPANLVSQAEKSTKTIEEKSETKKKNSKDIWDFDEVPETGAKIPDQIDKRPQPEYEIHYRQKVTTEDVFLQMGNKNPSSASCEYLVMNIQLPDTKLAEIILDITKTFLDCRSPKYRLALPLPHPVDPDNSQAKWDKDKSTLQVILRLNREYEELNF